ncbi:hypothetical protein ANN_10935 [Periplaneta americana]|uniref:Uncharacterized protein n=1 Tax=Periplaneta americana TaxID=6978 RepID=A0ABQ8T3M1_PERAM|nr:hypothetical protein ANN_10935 [Periplaneta americana]
MPYWYARTWFLVTTTDHLLPGNYHSENPAEDEQLCFHYSVMDYAINTAMIAMKNIYKPLPLNEKMVISLCSSLENLQQYFTSSSKLVMKLMIGQNEVGFTEASMKGLVPTTDKDTFLDLHPDDTVTIERSCFLKGSKTGEVPTSPSGLQPQVGLKLMLKFLEDQQDDAGGEAPRLLRSASYTVLDSLQKVPTVDSETSRSNYQQAAGDVIAGNEEQLMKEVKKQPADMHSASSCQLRRTCSHIVKKTCKSEPEFHNNSTQMSKSSQVYCLTITVESATFQQALSQSSCYFRYLLTYWLLKNPEVMLVWGLPRLLVSWHQSELSGLFVVLCCLRSCFNRLAINEMADHKEQSVCVKFSFLLGKTAAETVGMLRQAFDDDALGKSQVYEWFSRYKSGNTSTENMPRSGHPSTGRDDENIAKIKRAIDEDRRKTIDEVSEQTNLSWITVQRILTKDLHMRRVSAKFVPRLFTDDQRENHMRVCRNFKSEVQNDPNFLKRIVHSARTNSEPTFLFGCVTKIMRECAVKTARNVEKWELVASPRQCSSPHSSDGPTVFDKQQHGACASSTLLTRSGSVGLFFVTTDEEMFERKLNFLCRFHHPKAEIVCKSIPEVVVTEENKELQLQNVTCKMNFVSTHEEINHMLLTCPPKISICDTALGQGNQFAVATLNLAPVLTDVKKQGQCNIPLIDLTTNEEIVSIAVALALTDCGSQPIEDGSVLDKDSEQDLGPPTHDDRIAFRIVEELEDWKERQQKLFKEEVMYQYLEKVAMLKRKERIHLSSLTEEWKKHCLQLQKNLLRNMEKCRSLAQSLNDTTDDLRQEAFRTVEKEQYLNRFKEMAQQKYKLKVLAMREANRRLKDDLSFKIVKLEREKEDLEERLLKVEKENCLLKETVKAQELELDNLLKTSLTKDQTAAMLQELKLLEEKLEVTCKSKSFFKEQWARAVREILRLKCEHRKEIQIQIKHNKEELRNLGSESRLQHLLGEGEKELEEDKAAIQVLHANINAMKTFNSLAESPQFVGSHFVPSSTSLHLLHTEKVHAMNSYNR